MGDINRTSSEDEVVRVSPDALKKAEQYVEQEEGGALNKLRGALGTFVTAVAGIMPAICIGFLIYAVVGQYLPLPWTHYGMDVSRIVGHMYMTLEGIFGVPIDVSSSLIILFTIYGAVLQFSGAGKFFIDFSFAAMGGKPTGAGRTVVLASFLLGGPSVSGVATTVTLGTVAYPMLVKAGYGRNAAG